MPTIKHHMAKGTKLGILPPEHPVYREPWTVSAVGSKPSTKGTRKLTDGEVQEAAEREAAVAVEGGASSSRANARAHTSGLIAASKKK